MTVYRRVLVQVRRFLSDDPFVLSVLSVLVGAIAGAGAVVLREAIAAAEFLFYGAGGGGLPSAAEPVLAWRLFLALAAGGLLIGLFTRHFMPAGRPQGVADVIEANAVRAGLMSGRAGIGAALVSAVSIGCGASVGREGPAVHLGATLASAIGQRFGLNRTRMRILLGCGVAAAVAASFNAPVAGAIFALEVVIGHYAVPALAPIVVSSVAGTVVSRLYFGNIPAFTVVLNPIVSVWEFPAFALLGGASAVIVILFLRLTPLVETGLHRARLPRWSHPVIGGLAVGAIALWFPEVLGVGYAATDTALREGYALTMLCALLAMKMVATAISLGSGFGGGVFSPSLVIGAMLGGAFGVVAAIPFPHLFSGQAAYALVAMSAVSGAVLGAPISTILIIVELTADYHMTIAVMLAMVTASIITRHFHGASFFADQLKRRGMALADGHEVGLLRQIGVADIMRGQVADCPQDAGFTDIRRRIIAAPHGKVFVIDADRRLLGAITLPMLGEAALAGGGAASAGSLAEPEPAVAVPGDDLGRAIELFARARTPVIAVVAARDSRELVGCLHEHDVMRAYNRALLRVRAEEHGERTRHR